MLCCVGRGCCAASDAPESGWLQLASGNTVGSTLEMPRMRISTRHALVPSMGVISGAWRDRLRTYSAHTACARPGLRCGAVFAAELKLLLLTGSFSLTGADPLVDFTVSYFHFLSFRQQNQCKRERCRILTQVTFSTKFRDPPLSASLSAGERGGYKAYCLGIMILSHV